MKNIQIDRDVLYDLYITQNMSAKQIGDIVGVSKATIQSKLVKYCIVKDKQNILKTIHKDDKYYIDKDTIYDLYIKQNKSVEEVAKILDVSKDTILRRLKKYKIKKERANVQLQIEKRNLDVYGVRYTSQFEEIKEKIKKTNLEKYGTEYPLQSKEIRDKINLSNLEKYGCENPFQFEEVKQKIKKVNLEKYGVDHPMHSNQIKEKLKQTNLDRYGVENVLQSEKYKERIKNTNLEKYGVENPLQSEEVKQKIKQTNLDRYGNVLYTCSEEYKEKYFPNIFKYFKSKDIAEQFLINTYPNKVTMKELAKDTDIPYTTITQYIHKYGLEDYIDYSSTVSQPEKDIVEYLTSKGITNIVQSDRDILDGKEIDIYLPDYKVGIEFNGDYWHSELKRDKRYHYDKSMLANSKGVFLYHIFSHEWFDEEKRIRILNHLDNILHINENKIYARKCMIREVDVAEKNRFLNENHIQGKDSSSIKLGLYYNDELVSLMTFCYPRFSKKYNWELSRFCSKHNYNVIGGASKLFKYFVDNYMKDGEVIVSYSDIAKTTGKIYKTLNFEFVNDAEPNYIWWKSDDDYKTRYQCQMVNERIIMESNGYIKIYDCGNKVWVFRK